jgi:hypothetical protein
VPKYKIAHLKQNDVNLIVIPVAPVFSELTAGEKDQVIAVMQDYAVAAQLRGRVVPVWDVGGRMHFIAPQEWHNFFRTLKMRTIRANLNRELNLDDQPDATGIETTAEPPAMSQDMRDLLARLDPHEVWPSEASTDAPLWTRLARLIGLMR